MFYMPAIALVEASVLRDGGICRFSNEVVADVDGFLEFEDVQFRRTAPKGGTTIDVFSAFLKECGLLPKSKVLTSYHGHTYWRWYNSNASVSFDAQFDPVFNIDKPGFAGRCVFYITDGAPAYVTRKLRAALAKSCITVTNERGNADPIGRNKESFKNGPAHLHERVAKIRDTIKLDSPNVDDSKNDDSSVDSVDLNLSPKSIEFYERLLRGDRHRVRIH
jgi:hypothetical protein